MDWDIHQSVIGVLSTAGTEVVQYNGKMTTVQDDLTTLGSALTNSSLVATSLGLFATKVIKVDLTSIAGHSGTAVTATSDAVAFYAAGQTDMAANAQKYASSAAYPDDAPGAAKGAPLPKAGHGK